MLLAIDTATRYASVALYGEAGILAEYTWRSANNHSVELAPTIEDLLRRTGVAPQALTGVGVASGPGSFTGLRIGMSVAKGLCLALHVPIIGVPTLDVVAYAACPAEGSLVWAVLEAGRGRLSVRPYRVTDGLPQPVGDVALVSAAGWTLDAATPVLVTGEVSAEVAERLLAQPDGENIAITSVAGSLRRAGYLAELAWERLQAGEHDDLDTLSPLYANFPTSGTAD